MKTGLFIFDLDGTLIDSKKDIKNSFNFAFKKNKIKIINDSFFKLNASRGSKYFIKKNLKNKNCERLINTINSDFLKHYKVNCTKTTICKLGVIDFLKEFKKKNFLIISTNKNEIFSMKICKKLGIYKYFHKIYGSDTLSYKKPSKKYLKEIIKNYNIKKSKILIFGDSEVDYKLSSHYNLKHVLIDNGYTSLKNSQIKHDLLIKNFKNRKELVIKLLNK